jgi:hypothetical protein
MSGWDGGEEARVEELLRVNAELAAEVRSLTLGRREAPGAGPVPASRRLASLTGELEATQSELADMRRQRDSLLAHKEAQEREIARLRGGLLGALKRAQLRLRR